MCEGTGQKSGYSLCIMFGSRSGTWRYRYRMASPLECVCVCVRACVDAGTGQKRGGYSLFCVMIQHIGQEAVPEQTGLRKGMMSIVLVCAATREGTSSRFSLVYLSFCARAVLHSEIGAHSFPCLGYRTVGICCMDV